VVPRFARSDAAPETKSRRKATVALQFCRGAIIVSTYLLSKTRHNRRYKAYKNKGLAAKSTEFDTIAGNIE
jgi:hypothetical protein